MMRAMTIGVMTASLMWHAASAQTGDFATDIVIAQHRMVSSDRQGGIKQLLAPGTRVPKIGPNATVLAYVLWAKNALDRGQNAEAELSLEWGQVRRRVDEEENALSAGLPPPPYDSLCRRSICLALRSIGTNHSSIGREYLIAAIQEYGLEARPDADYADPDKDGKAASTALGIRNDHQVMASVRH